MATPFDVFANDTLPPKGNVPPVVNTPPKARTWAERLAASRARGLSPDAGRFAEAFVGSTTDNVRREGNQGLAGFTGQEAGFGGLNRVLLEDYAAQNNLDLSDPAQMAQLTNYANSPEAKAELDRVKGLTDAGGYEFGTAEDVDKLVGDLDTLDPTALEARIQGGRDRNAGFSAFGQEMNALGQKATADLSPDEKAKMGEWQKWATGGASGAALPWTGQMTANRNAALTAPAQRRQTPSSWVNSETRWDADGNLQSYGSRSDPFGEFKVQQFGQTAPTVPPAQGTFINNAVQGGFNAFGRGLNKNANRDTAKKLGAQTVQRTAGFF